MLAFWLPALALLLTAREGEELLGKKAKDWPSLAWLNSEPLSLEKLRGKVVLLRFWTDGCPFCERSAPAIVELHKGYKDRGLVVLGFYHPKPPRPVKKEEVAEAAKKLGFAFPIAVDAEWKTLKAWWLERDRAFTSSSFLLDRSGAIRYVHPGGEFHASAEEEHKACDRSYREIRETIEKLLAEPAPEPQK